MSVSLDNAPGRIAPGGATRDGAVPATLRRFLDRPAAPATGERCEMCGEAILPDHGHVVHLERRALMCTCRACTLLFTQEGAAGGRYRAVPDRYAHDPGFVLTDGQWEDLQIPVRMAFFFRNSALGRVVAQYPSPAGATESLLPLDTWAAIEAANPVVAGLTPDVEALLVNKRDTGFECFLVPIDVCYELVGRVRRSWKGFDGGAEAWRDIDALFDDLRHRAARSR